VQWRGALYGVSADDSLSSSKLAGVALGLDFERNLSQTFFTHFRGGVKLEAGSSSSLFTDEFKPESRLSLNDARVRWTFLDPLSITIGALEQEHLASPVLVSGGTFPAALLSLRVAPSRWYFEAHGQYAIPTGTGLSTRSTGKENTPSLLSQTAIVGWRKNPYFFVQARASHFSFANLTHGMAQDSRFYGNTVNGIATASTYAYKYEGFEFGPDLSLPLSSRFALVAGGSRVANAKGPTGFRTGQYAYAGFHWLGSGFKLRPIGEWYNNESDSAPAFYSSSQFGHNNRRGYGGSLSLTLNNPNLELSFRGRNTKLIDPQPFQKNNFAYYEFSIGMPYAPL